MFWRLLWNENKAVNVCMIKQIVYLYKKMEHSFFSSVFKSNIYGTLFEHVLVINLIYWKITSSFCDPVVQILHFKGNIWFYLIIQHAYQTAQFTANTPFSRPLPYVTVLFKPVSCKCPVYWMMSPKETNVTVDKLGLVAKFHYEI